MFQALTPLIIRRLTGAQDSHLQRVTIPETAHIQLRRGPPDDERSKCLKHVEEFNKCIICE
jgi:hypothetical protein